MSVEPDGEEHVGARRLGLGRHEQHARRVRYGLDAERAQRRLEERPVLEAIAAAPGGDELGEDAVEIDAHAASEEHVEVLERDGGHVGEHQGGNRVPV